MPTVTVQTFAAGDKNYVSKLNSNFAALAAAVNSLSAAISGGVGPGAQLITDAFDRPGLIGSHSYVLDIDGYGGGTSIVIGRRPAPVIDYGEQDVSAAWGFFGSSYDRVQQVGDVTLDASAITTGLPKTIYVGITSNGAPQLFESDAVPNVLYAYSMTWDGGSLSEFKRLAHILPGYSLIRDIARRPQMIDLYDSETDWVSDPLGFTSILLPGANSDNELAEMSYEVIGFYCNCTRADEDGFSAPSSTVDPDDNHVKFKVVSEGVDWTDEPFDFDCSNMPDFQFLPVSESNVGLEKFVVEARTFELERTWLGPAVASARAFQWGVVVRPIYGPAMPKDIAFVDQI